MALCFFSTQPYDIPNLLYRLTSLTDISILIFTIPTCISLLYHRKDMLFAIQGMCTFLGMFQTILPAFSVAIVAVLCITRTIQLFLLVRKPNKLAILSILTLYLAYLIISEAVPVLCGTFKFIYTEQEMYCWDVPVNLGEESRMAAYIEIAMDWISFSIPVIPIITCCIISTTKIWFSRNISPSNSSLMDLKSRATTTIMIFTAAYIVFNLPIFIVQLLRVLLFAHNESYPGRYFSNYFMYQYGWNVSKALLPAVNSAVNPVIYFARMFKFREWLLRFHTKVLQSECITIDHVIESRNLEQLKKQPRTPLSLNSELRL